MLVPAEARSKVALNCTLTVSLGARMPPPVTVAPVPTRTRTVRFAASYSAMSSPAASVFAPLFTPPGLVVTLIVPGTYDWFAASRSVITELSAKS